jgi:outer membrane murein-binding lipoprotein Lpp
MAIPEQAFAPCISAVYQSSAFAPAVSSLRRQVEQARDHLGSGNCRSSLDQLATGLAAVSRAIDTLKHDADAARSSAYRADTTTITRAWKTAVRSEFAMTDKCGN